jgi:hypothetical protein
MPARYALRLVGIIQACSCLYFVLMPAAFSHSLPDYFHTCLKFVLLLLFLVPWIHALTFYILDKPNWHKVLLTLLSLTYIYLEAPLHYFAAALLLHFAAVVHAIAFHPGQPDGRGAVVDCTLWLGDELGRPAKPSGGAAGFRCE